MRSINGWQSLLYPNCDHIILIESISILLFALLLIAMVVGFILGVKVVLIIIPAVTFLHSCCLERIIQIKNDLLFSIVIIGLMLSLAVEGVVIKGDIGTDEYCV